MFPLLLMNRNGVNGVSVTATLPSNTFQSKHL